MSTVGLAIRGMYRDTLIGPDGGVRLDSGWKANTIVETCRVGLARFLANDVSAKGIQFLYLGKGRPSTPAELPQNDRLFDEYEKPLTPADGLSIRFIDKNDTELPTSAQPTFRLKITATLQKEDAMLLTEFGLFGANSDGTKYMINYVHHSLIEKGANETLIRVIKLHL